MGRRHRKKAIIHTTARWQKQLRPLALAKSPTCVLCFEEVPVLVDHLDGNPDNNALENLLPECNVCHKRKTMRCDMVMRLYHVSCLHDALVYMARKIRHEPRVRPSFWDQPFIYNHMPRVPELYDFLIEYCTDRPTKNECDMRGYLLHEIHYALAVAELQAPIWADIWPNSRSQYERNK